MAIDLFTPLHLSGLALKNRFVMAPMTRDRAAPGHVPTAMNATYYAQRAGAGLIVTEGTPPDEAGQGYLRVPGLYTSEQVAGWRLVTDAVHGAGAPIFVQLMYVGRVSHPSFLGGHTPAGPSAVKAEGTVFTESGPQPFVTPRALNADEIPRIIATFGRAARLAVEAGFDGTELHATSGYLPHQFLAPNANLRTDEWGGSVENRARFLLSCVDAMAEARGPDRVGVRIGPTFAFNDVSDPDPQSTYDYVVRELDRRGLAYLHLINMPADWDALGFARERYRGVLIANGGYDHARANADLASGRADLIAFGTSFLANPDLPARFAQGAALNEADKATFYTEGEKGYIDYPALPSATLHQTLV